MSGSRKNRLRALQETVNIWVVLGAFVFACTLLIISLILLWFTRPAPSPAGGSTAVLDIIDAPTPTRPPITATAPVGSTLNPTDGEPADSETDDIILGARVQIKGTGGDGLRLRTEPGLENEVHLVGGEAEVFLVNDGPVNIDDYIWWYLVGLYDEKRSGWAVSNYLVVIQSP